MKQIFIFGFLVLLLCCCGSNTPANFSPQEVEEEKQVVHFIFEDKFDEAEKRKMEEWINFTSNCAQKVLGQYPFDLYYYFHRNDSVAQAVTFGYSTRADSMHAAHFYVNPSFSLEEFKADWIAPHEICHLAIPTLPKSNLWFYEGFATYMSRQVMIEMGVLSREEVDSINNTRICMYKDEFETASLLTVAADSLLKQYNYPAVYWMGTSFFVRAEKLLKERGKLKMTDVIKEFQACCHVSKMTMDELIESFDNISESNVFEELYNRYTTAPSHTLLSDFK